MSDVLSAVSENNLKDFPTDGWIKNYGYMPVAGNIKVDTMLENNTVYFSDSASDWGWDSGAGIAYWRLHVPEVTLEIPPEHRKSLEEAYDHLNTGNWQDTQPVRMSAAEYIKSIDPFLEEQPIGLPLSRVCKAFEAITGKPMSEEHAETFVRILEMCKGFATKEDSL